MNDICFTCGQYMSYNPDEGYYCAPCDIDRLEAARKRLEEVWEWFGFVKGGETK